MTVTATDPRTRPGYDIIGDVHGNAEKLEGLLTQLGYVMRDKVYRHPVRGAVFVGDLIDRGPSQLRVLEVVRAMVERRSAQIVMGNHELNALAYATPNPEVPGEFCRPHKPSNRRQHQEFLDQISATDREYYVRWFRSMPLWLDLGDFRVVHACWHEPSRLLIERELGGSSFQSLEDQIRATRHRDKSDLFVAVEIMLKGPETDLRTFGLPDFLDKDGKARHETRLRWWVENSDKLADLAELPEGTNAVGNGPYPVIDSALQLDRSNIISVTGDTPVIYGHYWRKWDPADEGYLGWQPLYGVDWTEKTACVDFAAVKGGPLVAYQWNTGDKVISPTQFAAYR
jgi:hypothetical protein